MLVLGKLRSLKGYFYHVPGRNPSLIRRFASTIYSLSSGYGKCGVAVIRVSGPGAKIAVQKIGGTLPKPRMASLRKLKHPLTNEVLDSGILLWFPAPKSFTGEDCCEFQVHGGPAVISSILDALGKIEGLRPAEQGEFTKRAFYSGKLDLTSVEGLADLINAETENQRKQAIIQMEGALYDLYTEWTKSLTKCLANLEAYIDFDDQNLENTLMAETENKLKHLKESIRIHLDDGRKGERLRSGVNMTIIGAPNVGKSSLLNILSRQPTAIVSPIPGTTRDLIKTSIDINGYPVNINDTAGLRVSTNDPIEIEGIARAKTAAVNSDLLILVLDGKELLSWLKDNRFDPSLESVYSYLLSSQLLDDFNSNFCLNRNYITCNDKRLLIIINKTDLLVSDPDVNHLLQHDQICGISCKNMTGIDTFVIKLSSNLKKLCGSPNKLNPTFTQARHRFCLQESLTSLDRFSNYGIQEVDLAAQEIRNALYSLGKITGRVTTDDILDVIFNDFCIGK